MRARAGAASDAAITIGTLLGANAAAALAPLAAHLARATGLAVRVAEGDGERSSDDASPWRHDLVWACGLLTARTLAAGGADGDVVAAPVFAGESAPRYRSVIVCRRAAPVRTGAELARRRVAINEAASWSGCHCLLAHLESGGHEIEFEAVTMTGSHRRSVAAVAEGRADAAAIDHTVWNHLAAVAPEAVRGLAVVGRTDDWPAPPFTLSRRLDAPVRAALLAGLTGVLSGDVPGLERVVSAGPAPYREMARSADARAATLRRAGIGAGVGGATGPSR